MPLTLFRLVSEAMRSGIRMDWPEMSAQEVQNRFIERMRELGRERRSGA